MHYAHPHSTMRRYARLDKNQSKGHEDMARHGITTYRQKGEQKDKDNYYYNYILPLLTSLSRALTRVEVRVVPSFNIQINVIAVQDYDLRLFTSK